MGEQQPPPRRPTPRQPAPRRPVPALPARVYWVRRAVVLGVPIVAVVLLVAWLTGRGGDEGPTSAAQTPAPTSSTAPVVGPAVVQPTPTTKPTTRPGGVADCAATDLVLAMTPTAVSFAAGVSPSFSVAITNTGAQPCLVDAGEASREIVITSGADRVWSSRDCAAADAQARDLLLPAGGNDTTQLAWNRVRSAPGCPKGLPAPGAGTYSAQFTLAGASAPAAVFGLG